MQLQTHSFPTRRSSTLPVDPLRHQRGRRPVPRLVEPVTALARLEVQLQRPRPARARPAYETRGGIDRARGADRHEQVGAGKRMIDLVHPVRSEEHTSELQSPLRISYAVFCLKYT